MAGHLAGTCLCRTFGFFPMKTKVLVSQVKVNGSNKEIGRRRAPAEGCPPFFAPSPRAVYTNETLWNVTLGLPDHSGLMVAASKRLVPRDDTLIDNLIRDLPWIVSAGCPTPQTDACAPVSQT
jgi:hypothetical protein